MTSVKIINEPMKPETAQILNQYAEIANGQKRKSIDSIPTKTTMIQKLINICNGTIIDVTLHEYIEEINNNMKMCDDQIEQLNIKKRDLTDVIDALNNINKTIEKSPVWIRFVVKDVNIIVDKVEYTQTEQNNGIEIKIKLASVDIKNIINLSNTIRELRLTTINQVGQKKILCIKFKINETGDVIDGYGISKINC